ncbi:MAG TPA: VCBS repeat-containing protein [Rubricoccaceae bacterium]
MTARFLPPPAALPVRTMDAEAADLDADGDLDLVLAGEWEPNVVLLNDGAGHVAAFPLPVPPGLPSPARAPGLAAGYDSEDIAIADLDGDGHLDLVFVSEDDAGLGRTDVHQVYRGHGDGTFERVPGILPDSEANSVAHADITGDGGVDLLVVGAGQDRLLINDGSGRFVDETASRLPVETETGQDAEFVDVDRDGDLDVALGNEGGHRLWVNDGTGHFVDESAARLPDPGNVEARKVTPFDVDGDGDADLFFSHVGWEGRQPQDQLALNDGAGRFSDATATHLPPDTLTTLDAKAVDVDGDGDPDLVRTGEGFVHVLLNDGTGRFGPGTGPDLINTVPPGAGIALEVADVDGDGVVDLFVGWHAGYGPGITSQDRLVLGVGAAALTPAPRP